MGSAIGMTKTAVPFYYTQHAFRCPAVLQLLHAALSCTVLAPALYAHELNSAANMHRIRVHCPVLQYILHPPCCQHPSLCKSGVVTECCHFNQHGFAFGPLSNNLAHAQSSSHTLALCFCR